MIASGAVSFREAEGSADLQQVHALNHRVFAEEISQHARQASGLLPDRFEGQSRYFLAVRRGRVVGMISVNPGPRFSVASRLPNPLALRELPKPLEVRLLAIEAQERQSLVLGGLLWQVYAQAASGRYSHLLISAIAEREAMYRKLGFQPLGPAIKEGRASFTPMMLQLAATLCNGSLPGSGQCIWRQAPAC